MSQRTSSISIDKKNHEKYRPTTDRHNKTKRNFGTPFLINLRELKNPWCDSSMTEPLPPSLCSRLRFFSAASPTKFSLPAALPPPRVAAPFRVLSPTLEIASSPRFGATVATWCCDLCGKFFGKFCPSWKRKRPSTRILDSLETTK